MIFAQQLTEKEYKELSRIFAYDVELTAGENDSHLSPKFKSAVLYTCSTVLELPKQHTTVGGFNKILVIANSSIYSQLTEKIDIVMTLIMFLVVRYY